MYNNIYSFNSPDSIVFGNNAINELGKKVKDLEGNKVLIVTDVPMLENGIVDKATDSLKDMGIESIVFSGVNTEPTVNQVKKGHTLFIDEGCDFLVGIGGGSCIDATKAIAVLTSHKGELQEYEGWSKLTKQVTNMVAVTTTAGTGSEVSRAAVITDESRKVKMVISSPLLIPKLAIVDPLLTISLPQKMTASSGIDALAHAIEGYISRLCQPISEVIALEAIKLISKNLKKAWAYGDNVEARYNMMLGQLLAGLVFSNSSTTIGHALARPLGAKFNIPHGISNGMMLPYGLEFTVNAAPEKLSKVSQAMGVDTANLSDYDSAKKSVNAVSDLCKEIEIPTIQEWGINRQDFMNVTEEMAQNGIDSGSFKRNPRIPTVPQIVQMYEKAYNDLL